MENKTYNYHGKGAVKRYYRISILILILFLIACGGGNSKQIKPGHLTSGMVQIKKGNLWYQKGCYKRALEHFLRAHELFAASDQIDGVAMSMNNIGNVYRIFGDNDDAVLFFDESYGIYGNIRDNEGAVHALSNKAAVLIDIGRLEQANNVLNKADSIAQAYGITYNPLLSNRGILLTREKEYERAEEVLTRALANAVPSHHSEFAVINTALGNLMLETERFERAIDFYKEALTADRFSGFYKGMADDLAAIGSAYFTQERYKPAVSFFQRSIKVYALIENENKVHEIMKQLDKAAEKTDLNISITKEFVKRWLAGEADGPCE